MKKKNFPCEIAYVLGVVLVAAGVAFSEKADFGVSMIVAPAYLLYRWLNPIWSFFTFGMAEYCFQALLLALLALVLRCFRISYLLSFATAVLYGVVLDGCMLLAAYLPIGQIWQRVIWYILGAFVFTPVGVAMMFHTYLSPEAYELFVKEISREKGIALNKFKTAYDLCSCLLGVIMSFAIFGFGHFVGISWGTILIALLNGSIIGALSKLYEKRWHFVDLFPWRPFFTGEERLK